MPEDTTVVAPVAAPTPTTVPGRRISLSLDYRIVIFVLLAVIAGMLLVWKPWAFAAKASDRTIVVTGESKVTAEPDEFVFSPSYTFKNADQATALKQLTAKSDEVVAKLKSLGLQDNQIKSNANGNDWQYYYDQATRQTTYTLDLTVTLPSRDKVQKVQDYLLTTTPSGSVSPQADFSESKRKALEKQARDLATKEARSKADQSAKNLGFKVGAVKSVDDGSGFGNIYSRANGIAMGAADASPHLSVQPGQNDLSYSVTVTYFVR